MGFAALPTVRPGPPEAWRARPYPQLLRGPNFTWWRPLLSLLIVVGVTLMLFVATLVGTLAVAVVTGTAPDSVDEAWTYSPPGLLMTNLTLAALIPVAQLGVWGGFGWRPRWVASVGGGLRWAFLARCYAVTLLVMALAFAVMVALEGGLTVKLESSAGLYALVVLLTTPLQSAGEEYFFRGWLSQAVASWVPSAVVGAVLAAGVSATAFAFAHGTQNLWLFADRFLFGLVASWLVWRTGGLEASIAVHGANNVLSFGLAIITGQVGDMLASTEATVSLLAWDAGILAVVVGAVELARRRWSVQRLFHPPVR